MKTVPDSLLYRWLGSDVSDQERADLCDKIESDQVFREEFCEWIKTLRDPGARIHAAQKNPQES